MNGLVVVYMMKKVISSKLDNGLSQVMSLTTDKLYQT
ncbi:unnamed protein product [Paramecium primaurelia]|uniref:Uncharacterized protein n=1 Tax=Paramecium primaurelia TaxID=5886 RepID=A0A8S1QE17_PARPR|nr:unnamed protein product [Paramecium primaurelia]